MRALVMTNLFIFLAGVLLGIFVCGVLAFLLAVHRYPAPTLHRRKNRDLPGRSAKILTEGNGDWLAPYRAHAEPHEPIYMYGVTGEEQ